MKRNRIKVPADYNDASQSDSDPADDPLFNPGEENAPSSPASPQVSGEVSDSYRRKRQRQKNNQGRQATFEEANRALNAERNRITISTPDEISGPVAELP